MVQQGAEGQQVAAGAQQPGAQLKVLRRVVRRVKKEDREHRVPRAAVLGCAVELGEVAGHDGQFGAAREAARRHVGDGHGARAVGEAQAVLGLVDEGVHGVAVLGATVLGGILRLSGFVVFLFCDGFMVMFGGFEFMGGLWWCLGWIFLGFDCFYRFFGFWSISILGAFIICFKDMIFKF